MLLRAQGSQSHRGKKDPSFPSPKIYASAQSPFCWTQLWVTSCFFSQIWKVFPVHIIQANITH